MMKMLRTGMAVMAAMIALLSCNLALGQAAGAVQSITPMTRDLGNIRTMTAQGAGTIVSSDQTGFNVSRVTCVFNSASQSGTPSSTFKIQNKDAASGLYYDLVTSAAITAANTPTPISTGAGVSTVTNVAAGLPVARTWRVSATVGGTTPSITGTIGCSVQ